MPPSQGDKLLQDSDAEKTQSEVPSGYAGQSGSSFLMHWIRSGLLAAVFFCPAGIIGLNGGLDRELTTTEKWCAVFLPGGLWYVLTVIVLGGRIAEKLAGDMVEERSAGVSMRDAIRSSLTNTGVVSALFLTVVLAMSQMDPFEGPANFRSLWYLVFVLMAVSNCMEAVVMCSFCMLYVEPLSDDASLNFLKDNMIYVGEPLTRMSMGVINLLLGLTLWIYETHGIMMGTFMLVSCWYVCMRLMVCYANLSSWQNMTIPESERAKNTAFRDWKYMQWFTGKPIDE